MKTDLEIVKKRNSITKLITEASNELERLAELCADLDAFFDPSNVVSHVHGMIHELEVVNLSLIGLIEVNKENLESIINEEI